MSTELQEIIDSDAVIPPGIHDLTAPLVLGRPGYLGPSRLRGAGRAITSAGYFWLTQPSAERR